MAVFAASLPFLPFVDRNEIDRATLILIYVLLGTGLNITVGLAGLLDLGYAAFYAVGAYSYALLVQHFGLSFWACLPLAAALAALFALVVGLPVLRLRGDYLAIVTLGFGQIAHLVLVNGTSLTGGPNGIAGIPQPDFFGLPFAADAPEGAKTFAQYFDIPFSPLHRVYFLYYLILAMVLIAGVTVWRLRRLPVGLAWEALREDEIACKSLGIDPQSVKLSAYALGAAFAALAGTFFAARQGFISPENFTFNETAIVLAIVVLGGMRSQLGIALAAILLIGLPDWFRDLAQYRMLAFGAVMVMVMVRRPKGLAGERRPTVRLKLPAAAAAASAAEA
jgi:branched-chain amino acid transport system permease protein